MDFVLSNHVIERALERGITQAIIYDVLKNPQQILDDNSIEGETGQKVYQSLIEFSDKSTYLVRVFVNIVKDPYVVKTVYKTSNISKYYEGKV